MTAAAFRKFLKRHSWTMYRFAKLTGIAESTVQHWANVGIVRPQDKLLVEMIDRYGLEE